MPQIKTLSAARLSTQSSFLAQLRLIVSDALIRRRERAMLARLDRRILRDIGVDPVTAATEAAKPFWKA